MENYCKDVLKVVVAQICSTMGWHRIQTTPMEVMVDILSRYLRQMATRTNRYAEHFGMTEPTLDHVGIMMRDMHINLQEIEEYINWVEPMPCVIAVPKIPVAKESQLNFLKPGSREVVTRPVHVHEHLPPMFPELEVVEEEQRSATPTEVSPSSETVKVLTSPEQSDGENVFKRPGDPISDSQPSKRPKLSFGEEGRPTREISSVMMTSSGFLSPAREGKLPESRTPISVIEPQAYPTQPPEVTPRVEKKIKKGGGDGKRKEFRTELFKPDKILGENGMKIKKIPAKESKLKPFKKSGMSAFDGKGQSLAKQIPSDTKIQKITIDSTESIEETRVQISSQSAEIGVTIIEIDHKGVRKLSSEPDKVKLNIFKKISSKNKEEIREKAEKEHRKSDHFNLIVASQNSREHAVDIIPINDKFQMKPEKCKTPEITIKEESLFPSIMQNREVILTPAKVVERHIPTYDLASSPPPSKPKTPEIQTVQTPLTSKKLKVDKEKKKRKDKLKKIKGSKERAPKEHVKHLNKRMKLEKILNINSKRMLMLEKQRLKTPPADLIKSEPMESFEDDIELNDRPKTPNDPITIKTEQPPILPTFPFITQFPSGPGLIPKTVYPPFFPRGIGKHGFGQPPILPNNALSLVKSPSPSPIKSEFPTSPPPTPVPTTTHLPSPIKIEAEIEVNAMTTPSPIIKMEKKNKEHKKDKKDKLDKLEKKKLKKKDKKDKKKLKEKAVKKLEKLKMKNKKEKKHKEKVASVPELISETSVPKLTLKLGPPQQRASTPDGQITRKITIKSIKKSAPLEDGTGSIKVEKDREMSPELAQFSALVTRPPKTPKTPKVLTSPQHDKDTSQGTVTSSTTNSTNPILATTPTRSHAGPGRPRGSTNAAKAAAAAAAAAAVQSAVSSPPQQQLIVQPPPQQLPTTSIKIHQPSSSSVPHVQSNPSTPRSKHSTPGKHKHKSSSNMDKDGEKVWICPACGRQDDGSPMIGCDDCDAWYHWVCVGIQVPPDENEDWYCKICIGKKQESFHTDKKKKRKKKERKEH